jgi:hypothetical protein
MEKWRYSSTIVGLAISWSFKQRRPPWKGGQISIHWLRGWGDPGAGLGRCRVKKILLACREENPDCPAPTLYQLSYIQRNVNERDR